jgi:hypothetical protein
MKIEMGESLIFSWLKHIKRCQLVQTNWKVSPNWTFENKDLINVLMEKSNTLFSQTYGYNIYKNNSLDQLILQSEADVVGISFDENGSQIYAVDVAFHEAGLNYGSRQETVERVIKKCIRTAMCILGCFNISYGNIVFASPKINPAICADIVAAIADVNGILAQTGLEYDVKLYCNESFDKEILFPVVQSSANISDTSELFLRGLQMYQLFYTVDERKQRKVSEAMQRNNKDNGTIAQSHEDCIAGFENIKVAEIARTALVEILESGIIPAETIEKMQTKEYSKENFDLQFPLLLKVSSSPQRPIRYMAKPIVHIRDEAYYICSEWFEKPGGNNDRPYLLKWIAEHRLNN